MADESPALTLLEVSFKQLDTRWLELVRAMTFVFALFETDWEDS